MLAASPLCALHCAVAGDFPETTSPTFRAARAVLMTAEAAVLFKHQPLLTLRGGQSRSMETQGAVGQ